MSAKSESCFIRSSSISDFVHFCYIRLPAASFCIALCTAAFAYGLAAAQYHIFPYGMIKDALASARAILDLPQRIKDDAFIRFRNIKIQHISNARITPIMPNAKDALLFTGGWRKFLEYCPKDGCVAVSITREGTLHHAYPFLPNEYWQHLIGSESHIALVRQHFTQATEVFGIAKFDNGDLAVSFFSKVEFPAAGAGIARIDRNGHVKWFRNDYSHHWPVVVGEEIWSMNTRLARGDIRVPISPDFTHVISCKAGYVRDSVQMLDARGQVTDEISIFDAILLSNYRAVLLQLRTADQGIACDPLHLNFVRPVGADLAVRLKVSPDDLLVSMRNISAFGIVGRADHKLKYLFRGSFLFQHSVQPYRDGKVLIFDNRGIDEGSEPSRLLLYDLENLTSSVLFSASSNRPTFTFTEGNISVAPDGERVIVTISDLGRAYEIKLKDRSVIADIENLQNISSLAEGDPIRKSHAALYRTHGIYYDR